MIREAVGSARHPGHQDGVGFPFDLEAQAVSPDREGARVDLPAIHGGSGGSDAEARRLRAALQRHQLITPVIGSAYVGERCASPPPERPTRPVSSPTFGHHREGGPEHET